MELNNNIQETLNQDQNDIEKLLQHLTITNTSESEFHDISDEEEEEEKEEEFSFMSLGAADTSPVAAEDAFIDGHIKPVFPLFNLDLMLSSEDHLPMQPHVQKVFVEIAEDQMASSTSGSDEISGPYCDLSNRKVVEVDADTCKKSNSTGFSKIWRFKDFIGRSNSDGRDAFVFLNNNNGQPTMEVKKDKETVNVVSRKMKKATTKVKTASSSHEVYLRRKAKDEERRRPSYLPYRPELMGFFTSVNGGLTRNVHPY